MSEYISILKNISSFIFDNYELVFWSQVTLSLILYLIYVAIVEKNKDE